MNFLNRYRVEIDARYQRYDWGMNQLAEWIDQPAEGIILIDGVYSFRPELRKILWLLHFCRHSEGRMSG